MAEEINVNAGASVTTPGSVGLNTQQVGQATTVDGLAGASGGIGAGNLFDTDIDDQLFVFEGDDTPLMSMMLKAKKVKVKSPKVQHYMLDEERTNVSLVSAVTQAATNTFVLPMSSNDATLCQVCTQLRVRGVDGYDEKGKNVTRGIDLTLYVTGKDASGMPIVRCVNGPKANETDAYCTTPAIPAGSAIDVLSTAMHETQKEVAPDSVQPVPTEVYLQKRGMNRIVSDYFDSQKKRIPFADAIIAERAIRKFKRAGNRTLWISKKGQMQVEDPKTGMQVVYFTEGLRWQFKREFQHTGKWSFEQFIALAKMYYTSADVPENATVLAGKNFLENIQCIDFKNHPEVKIEVKTHKLGWQVTSIHTVFGDFEFKRDPTLDRLGYSNSAAIIGNDRLVHYQRTAEHSDTERVEGHEASRESLIVWDALALKGSCHIFINGDGGEASANAVSYVMWDSTSAPTGADLVEGRVYCFTADVKLTETATAKQGETWQYKNSTWSEYTEAITV